MHFPLENRPDRPLWDVSHHRQQHKSNVSEAALSRGWVTERAPEKTARLSNRAKQERSPPGEEGKQTCKRHSSIQTPHPAQAERVGSTSTPRIAAEPLAPVLLPKANPPPLNSLLAASFQGFWEEGQAFAASHIWL